MSVEDILVDNLDFIEKEIQRIKPQIGKKQIRKIAQRVAEEILRTKTTILQEDISRLIRYYTKVLKGN